MKEECDIFLAYKNELLSNLSENLIIKLNNKGLELKEAYLKKDFYFILETAIKNMTDDQLDFFNIIQTKLNSLDNNNEYNIYDNCKDEDNDFINNIYMLAGLPGTGKSYIQTVIHLSCVLNKNINWVYSLAPNNHIALQQKGTTIHSDLGPLCKEIKISNFKLEDSLAKRLFDEQIIENRFSLRELSITKLVESIRQLIAITKKRLLAEYSKQSKNVVILIDEGTMVSNLLFALLIVQYPQAIFVVMYGPNQLPPISQELKLPNCEVSLLKNNCPNMHCLKTQMRFSDDSEAVFKEFIEYFSDHLSKKTDSLTTFEKLEKISYFMKNITIGGTLEDYNKLPHNDKILIVGTNFERVQENAKRLAQEGKGQIFSINAELDPELPQNYNVGQLGVDKVLKIRIGVPCLCRFNDITQGLAKGTIVTVEDVKLNHKGDVNYIVIKYKFKDKYEQFELKRHKFDTGILRDEKDERSALIVSQFPLTLAYSLTTHACQGMNLKCKIGINLSRTSNWNLSSHLFFVAITRIFSQKQLYMNEHPASWLEKDLNIQSQGDIDNLKFWMKKRKFSNTINDDNIDDNNNNNNKNKRGLKDEDYLKNILIDYNYKKKIYDGDVFNLKELQEFIVNK